MRNQIQQTQPSCHCHYIIRTDGATFPNICGTSKTHALLLFRDWVRGMLGSGIVPHLPDGYLANRRAEFVRCPTCSC